LPGIVLVERRPDADNARVNAIISVDDLSKTYASGFEALRHVNLEIRRGEIFALLGPNGAGKTTLISIICGIVTATSGRVRVDGHDIDAGYRKVRSMIGLVPQELTTDAFETPWDTVNFSRGLFGKPPDPALVERVLRDLSLWEKRANRIMTLSGGMKRRLLIAKALAHEPTILFLDEPTAGVDVELRKDMWQIVRRLRDSGVTIILTTHYIEEAEEMADRVGVISNGELIIVEEKNELMRKLGRKQLVLQLASPLAGVPPALARFRLEPGESGRSLVYTYDTRADQTGITALLDAMDQAGIEFVDLQTIESSLEDIFVDLVRGNR
jgi:ABC-2 type transport system ATP-binding protein